VSLNSEEDDGSYNNKMVNITAAILLASYFVPGIKWTTFNGGNCRLRFKPYQYFIKPVSFFDSAAEHIDAGIFIFLSTFYAGTRRLFCVGFVVKDFISPY